LNDEEVGLKHEFDKLQEIRFVTEYKHGSRWQVI